MMQLEKFALKMCRKSASFVNKSKKTFWKTIVKNRHARALGDLIFSPKVNIIILYESAFNINLGRSRTAFTGLLIQFRNHDFTDL